MKKVKWILLSLALVCLPMTTVNAEENTKDEATKDGKIDQKDEVIYANLQADGLLDEMYVVNAFELSEHGLIKDYGLYDEVKNLTDTSDVEQNQEKMTMETDKDTFYYQGDLPKDKRLPWKFALTYYLDGKETPPEEMIGQAGEVEIELAVKQDDKDVEDFFKNYMIQISVPLNTDHFHHIEAEEATIASAGKEKQIAFTVMPEEEETFVIEATTDKFEIEGFEISALPSAVSVDGPDTDEIDDEFQSLTDAIGDIDGGVRDLRDGMDDLTGGLSELESGSSEYQSGINELNESGDDLTSASAEINEGIATIYEEINQASGADGLEALENFDASIDDMVTGMEELADGLDELATQNKQANEALQEAVDAVPDSTITEADIEALYETEADPDVVEELVTTYEAAQTVKAVYEEVVDAFDAVDTNLDAFSEATNEVADHIRELAEGIDESLGDIDVDEQLVELMDGLEEMATSYDQFHNGLLEYTGGVDALAQNYEALHEGIGEAKSGASELTDGASELRNGTKQLYDATSGLPDEMKDEIDEMISQYDKSDFDAPSFVSEKNDDVIHSVQFVINTDSLEEEEADDKEEEEEAEEGFFEMLLNLFK